MALRQWNMVVSMKDDHHHHHHQWGTTSRSKSSISLMKMNIMKMKKKNRLMMMVSSESGSGGSDSKTTSSSVPNSNYVVPLDKKAPSCITRPLAEILRDLNKRIPDNILKPHSRIIPWYHANRMLSFYAPGWCGEVRDVIFSNDGSVTVVYRVTIRGSDGEAYRESTGTIASTDSNSVDSNSADPVAAAEEIAFVRACARFGLGLYLYHE